MNSEDIALRRANAYRFFSLIYAKEPSPQFVNEIKRQPVRGVLEALGVVFDELFDADNAAAELGFEYMRLFIGTGPKYATPYESVFKDAWRLEGKRMQKMMWGDSTVEVKKTYEQNGFVPESKFKDIPDHLAVELAYLEALCRAEVKAIKDGDKDIASSLKQKQAKFLNEHLLAWIDKFVDEVNKLANLQFYRTVALATAQFLKFDYEELKKSV